MSSSLKAVDLTGATVGQKFTLDFSPFVKFDPATRNPMVKAHLSLFNESGCGLQLMMVASGQGQYLPAGAWTTVDLEPNDSHMDMVVVYTLPNPPVSQLGAVYFGPGEEIHGNYTLGNSPIGIGGSVTTTGQASADFFNVKDISFAGGAKGDAVTDDTAAIAAARLAASINGGIVFYPEGIYITGNLPDYDNVTDMGSGVGATTLRLKAASNTDLFGSRFTGNINLTGAMGSGSASASKKWCIQDMTLDGNKANQSAGPSYVIRVYAYAYKLSNVLITGGFSGGILRDYYGPFPSSDWDMETMWNDVHVTLNNGIGVQLGGPTDSMWVNGIVNSSVSHNIHITPHSSQMLFDNVHAYTNSPQPNTNACAWLIEAGASCVNCIAETSGAVQIALVTNNIFRWIGGSIFAGSYAGIGIQIGQAAGNTPFLGQINQAAGVTTALTAAQYYFSGIMLQNISNVNGYIQFVSDGGGYINYIAYKPGGSPAVFTGTKSTRTTIISTVLGSTPNQTLENDGGIATQGPIASNLTPVDLAGDTSGFAHCYEDQQGSIKRVVIILDNYKHVGATQPQFVLPVPFLKGAVIHVGNINTNVACWQGGVAQNINVITAEGTFTPNASIGPFLWGEVTAAFDRVLLPDLMGSVVGRAMIEIVGN